MANKTISDLPSASTPVAGDKLIINQDGGTKKLDITDLSNSIMMGTTIRDIADLKAFDDIVDNKTVDLLGYYTEGDGGGGTFYWDATSAVADNGGTVIAPTFAGFSGTGRWTRVYSGAVDVKWFGARGNNIQDDTAFIQACIDECKVHGEIVYVPKGTYLTTTSLDFTFSEVAEGRLGLMGDGRKLSVINPVLVEAYPAIDFVGNQRGFIRGIGVRNGNDSSLATCQVFLASNAAATNTGNTIRIDDVDLWMPKTQTNATACIVVFNSDVTTISDSELDGKIGVQLGFIKPASVTSKFQTVNAGLDFTKFRMTNSVILGLQPVVFTGGSGGFHFDGNCYLAMTGAGTAGGGIVLVDTGGQPAGNVLSFNCRSENQSSATGISFLYLKDSIRNLTMVGVFSCGSGGYTIRGEAGAGLSSVFIRDDTAGMAGFFDMIGDVYDADISNPNMPAIGNVGENSSGLKVYSTQNVSGANSVATDWPNNIHSATKTGTTLAHFVPSIISGAPLAVCTGYGKFLHVNATASAYTGGTGDAEVYRFTIPAGVLTDVVSSGQPKPSVSLRIYMEVAGTAAVGTVKLRAIQGATDVEMLSWSAVPAGDGLLVFKSDLIQLSSNNSILSHGQFTMKSTSKEARKSLSGVLSDADWKSPFWSTILEIRH